MDALALVSKACTGPDKSGTAARDAADALSRASPDALAAVPPGEWLPSVEAIVSRISADAGTRAVSRLPRSVDMLSALMSAALPRLPGRALKVLFAHLRIALRAQRYASVSAAYLDMLYASASLLSVRERFDLDAWEDYVAAVFSILLGRDIDVGDEGETARGAKGQESRDNRDLREYDGFREVEPRFSRGLSLSDGESSRIGQDSPQPNAKYPTKATATPVDLKAARCLDALLSYARAPFGILRDSILRLLLSALNVYRKETTAHKDLVSALNKVLAHVLASGFAHTDPSTRHSLLLSITKLWVTKSWGLKEQALIALRHLVLLAHTSHAPHGTESLYSFLSRNSKELALPLDSLFLDPRPHTLFSLDTFALHSTDTHHFAWNMTELLSDCLYLCLTRPTQNGIFGIKKESSVSDSDEDLPYTKKQKTKNSQLDIMDVIDTTAETSLQCLTFFIERKWEVLSEGIRERTVSLLKNTLKKSSSQLSDWLILCSTSTVAKSRDVSLSTLLFEKTVVLISDPAYCRTASHALSVVLQHSVLKSNYVTPHLCDVFRNFAVSAPSLACDSSLSFFLSCLELSGTEPRLNRALKILDIMEWIQRTGLSLSDSRNLGATLKLVVVLCRLDTFSLDYSTLYSPGIPDSAMASAFVLWHRIDKIQRQLLSPMSKDVSKHKVGDIVGSSAVQVRNQVNIWLIRRLLEASEDNVSLLFYLTLAVYYLGLFRVALGQEIDNTDLGKTVLERIQYACDMIYFSGEERYKGSKGTVYFSIKRLFISSSTYFEECVSPVSTVVQDSASDQTQNVHQTNSVENNQVLKAFWDTPLTKAALSEICSNLSERIVGSRYNIGRGLHSSGIRDFSTRSSHTTNASESSTISSSILAPLAASASLSLPGWNLNRLLQNLPGTSDGSTTVGFLEEILHLSQKRLIQVDCQSAQLLLDYINGTLLASAAYAKDPRFLEVGIQLLEASLHLWAQDTDSSALEEYLVDFRSDALVSCKIYAGALKKGGVPYPSVRLKLYNLLDAYLRTNTLELGWQGYDNDDEAVAVPYDKSTDLASDFIVQFLADEDIYVRLNAATRIPGLLRTLHLHGTLKGRLYGEVNERLRDYNTEDVELAVSNMLFATNVILLAPLYRAAAYVHLMYTLDTHSSLGPLGRILLDKVCRRFNMASPDLHLFYCRLYCEVRLKFGWESHAYEQLLSAEEQKDASSKYLSVFVKKGKTDMFRTTCSHLNVTEAEGYLVSFPYLVVDHLLVFLQGSNNDNKDAYLGDLKKLIRKTGVRDSGVSQYISPFSGYIYSHLLLQIGETTWRPDSLSKVQNSSLISESLDIFSRVAPTEERCTSFGGNDLCYSLGSVVQAIMWLNTVLPVFSRKSVLFQIVYQHLKLINKAPFLQDKVHISYCLMVGLSVSYSWAYVPHNHDSELNEVTLSDAVCELICQFFIENMEANPGLMPTIRPLFFWALSSWLALVLENGRTLQQLTTFYVAASHRCERLGANDILAFIRDEVSRLGAKYEQDCNELALLMPYRITSDAVSMKAVRKTLYSSKFKGTRIHVIRHLDNVIEKDRSSNLSQMLFWLVSSMSEAYPPTVDECTALADLIYRADGSITTPQLTDKLLQKKAKDFADSEPSILETLTIQAVTRLIHTFDVDISLLHVLCARTASEKIYVTDLGDEEICYVLYVDSSLFMQTYDALLYRLNVSPSPMLSLSDLKSLSASNYSLWLRSMSGLLCNTLAKSNELFKYFYAMADKSFEFAQQSLPFTLQALLMSETTPNAKKDWTSALSWYFSKLISAPEGVDPQCISCILRCVFYLRNVQRPDRLVSPDSRDAWLSIPYLDLAKAAVEARYFHGALLALELSHEYEGILSKTGAAKRRSLAESDDSLEDKNTRAQTLLHTIYSCIGEVDGFYGFESHDPIESLMQRYEHEENWSGAFALHSALYENSAGVSSEGVSRSLFLMGLTTLSSELSQRQEDAQLGYDLAWRLQDWSLPVSTTDDSHSKTYMALKMICTSGLESDTSAKAPAIDAMVYSEVHKLQDLSLDRPVPHPGVISCLLSLREARMWCLNTNVSGFPVPEYLDQLSSTPDMMDFALVENVFATRLNLIQSTKKRCTMRDTKAYGALLYQQTQCLVKLSELARENGNLQLALNSVTQARKLAKELNSSADSQGVGAFDGSRIEKEFANILWMRGEHAPAIKLLQNTLESKETKPSALILSNLGEWMAEAKQDLLSHISANYFEPAVAALKSTENMEEHSQVYAAYALFADTQYEETRKVLEEKKKQFHLYSQRKRAELQVIERHLRSSSTSSQERGSLERNRNHWVAHLKEDENHVKKDEKLVESLLWNALENYAKAFISSDVQDHKVFRFVALFLSHESNDVLQKKLEDYFSRISSHKFVFLAYQLSARMSNDKTAFANNVLQLVYRICKDHPFHCLYAVHALRDPGTEIYGKRSSNTKTEHTPRGKAAEAIFDKTRNSDRLRARVNSIELACEAYSEWSNYSIKDNSNYLKKNSRSILKGDLPIPSDVLLLKKVKNLSIPVSTFSLPIDRTCEYVGNSIPCISHYGKTFVVMGGIHAPKVVSCYGTDGKIYKQLMKGEDDIRQDAVMEQAFMLINNMLDKDKRTRKRQLKMRTYKVIPLRNKTGVIEFVTNTKPLGDIIIPLYDAYLPAGAFNPQKARTKLREIELNYRSSEMNKMKDSEFKRILTKVKPLMRFFFLQRQSNPTNWFNMRLNYSRSVAAISIIGYVMGLGDRHVSNILMDDIKGELVTIDLGIAFDQGQRLPIPETIPFRLTQNIVDGLGMSGVDGVFRRGSEEIMNVLREQSTTIITVLEVFKHDPLQNWGISIDLIKRVQNLDEEALLGLEDLPDDADRAMSIIATKLDNRLSVEYTVNQLIREATDPQRLGRLFSGWQPYL